MYHYVRDLPNTRFPAIKGMLTSDFAQQVEQLRVRYEMATLDSALAFLAGEYRPERALCLLTFDDGLADHYTEVFPILQRHKIQGLFFITTSCTEDGVVADVHKNHFLMAELPFSDYRERFMRRLTDFVDGPVAMPDQAVAVKKYRWDTPDVAVFKYLLNFGLAESVRSRVLSALFGDVFGDEATFSRGLYLSWGQAQEMQAGGMVLGGHSNAHRVLTDLGGPEEQADLTKCAMILKTRTLPQALWPFSYPFGHAESFNDRTIDLLREVGFECAFTTFTGPNESGVDRFRIHRIDPKDLPTS